MRQHQPADDHDGGKDLRRFGRRVFSATLTRVCNWPEEGMTFHSAVVSGARSRDCLLSSQAYRRRARDDPPDPCQVRTKNAKTFTSVFFPVSDHFHDIAVNWIRYLREENGFGPNDPLFQDQGHERRRPPISQSQARILKPRCMTLSRCFRCACSWRSPRPTARHSSSEKKSSGSLHNPSNLSAKGVCATRGST